MGKRIALLGLICTMLLSGCGAASYDSAETATKNATADVSYEYGEEAAVDDSADAEAVEDGVEAKDPSATEKKLIVTEQINVETSEYQDFITTVTQKVDALGGYIESSEMSGSTQYQNQYADFTIRIPADKLADFITVVDQNGTVTYDSKTTEDVTLEYVDTESHLKALKTEEETLLALLEKAEKLSDVFEIQEELTNVRYQIESYESKIRVYDNQVDYSTVHLNVMEVERENTTAKKGFWSEAGAAFLDSLYNVGYGLRNFGIWLIGNIPVFFVLAVVIAVIVWIVKKVKKVRKKKEIHTKEEKIKE